MPGCAPRNLTENRGGRVPGGTPAVAALTRCRTSWHLRARALVTLVLHYRRTSRHALNVLAGAVEVHPASRGVEIRVAEGPAEVARRCTAAAATGRRAVVAWSFCTASAGEVAAELAAVRREVRDGRALHVAGGPHPSGDPAGTLRAGFDLAAVGEGEETLPRLLGAVATGSDPRAVPGLAWLDGGALRTGGRALPADLDAFPPCAPGAARIGPVEISRGCAWGCRFCQTPFLFRARWRHRSLDSVRRWIGWFAEVRARDVRFLTPSALSYGASGGEANLDAVEALLATARQALAPGMRMFLGTFPSELRPEHVSPRALALLRRHCDNRAVLIGGQSGSDRMLAAMARGHDAEAVLRAARLAVEAGFSASVDLVFGLPGEEEDDREASRRLAKALAASGAVVHAHAFMPLPGTPWARAPAGWIDGETRRLLERLGSVGLAQGQWRRQEAIAARACPGPK